MNVLDEALVLANAQGKDHIDDILTEHGIEVVDSAKYDNLNTLVVSFTDSQTSHLATIAYVRPKGKWYFIKETKYPLRG